MSEYVDLLGAALMYSLAIYKVLAPPAGPIAPHGSPSPSPPHGRVSASGSPDVFVNGSPATRIGDAIACGGVHAAGSPDTIVN